MNFKRKLVKVQIEGEDVWLRQPNAVLQIRIAAIGAGEGSEQEKYLRIMAEAIAACLVDEAGALVFDSPDTVLSEMDTYLLASVSTAILESFPQNRAGKNSESVQNSSSPSTSPES
jgi:hypothetical protein